MKRFFFWTLDGSPPHGLFTENLRSFSSLVTFSIFFSSDSLSKLYLLIYSSQIKNWYLFKVCNRALLKFSYLQHFDSLEVTWSVYFHFSLLVHTSYWKQNVIRQNFEKECSSRRKVRPLGLWIVHGIIQLWWNAYWY